MINFIMKDWKPTMGEDVYLSHPVTGNKFARVNINGWGEGCFYITFRDLTNYRIHSRHCIMKPIVSVPIPLQLKPLETEVGDYIHYSPRESTYLVVGDGISQINGTWVPAWSYVCIEDDQFYTKPKTRMLDNHWRKI